MTFQAWIIFLCGAIGLAAYCVVMMMVGKGSAKERRQAVSGAVKDVFKQNKKVILVSMLGMFALNGFLGAFPVSSDVARISLSGAEKGRVLVALALYLLFLAGWYGVLWKAARAVKERVGLSAQG